MTGQILTNTRKNYVLLVIRVKMTFGHNAKATLLRTMGYTVGERSGELVGTYRLRVNGNMDLAQKVLRDDMEHVERHFYLGDDWQEVFSTNTNG